MYGVHPREYDEAHATPESVLYVQALKSRIEHWGRQVLGDSFVDLVVFDNYGLMLHVKAGTASGKKKFLLRSFLGWIELFDYDIESDSAIS